MPKSPKPSSSGSHKQRNIPQNTSTRFHCPHCPFQGCSQKSLETHLFYHNTKNSLQCLFCTYSVSNSKPFTRHMNRVHPKETAAIMKQSRAEKSSTPNVPELVIQPSVEAEDPQFEEAAQLENEISAAGEMVYVTIETEDCYGEEVMMIQDDPDNPLCLSCGKQSDDNRTPVVQCDQCDNWFHCSCLGPDNQLDGLWFCPACIHKESPRRHMAKLIKAVHSLTQIYGSGQLSSGLSTSLPNSHDGHLHHIADPSTSVQTVRDAMGDAEEIKCREELAQSALDISSSRAKVAQASKDLQEETCLKRASRAENLHQRMEKLKLTDQDLSVELAVLIEAKRRNLEGDAEKTQLKIKMDEQLFNLRLSSCTRVKKEASVGSSFSLEATEEEEIQKLERLVAQLKKKLGEIWEEESSLNKQIQATKQKLEENSKNLESLQALFFNPAQEESSEIATRIKK